MEKIIIRTDLAPRAIGPYSQAVRVGQFVFVSGCLGLDPQTGALREGHRRSSRLIIWGPFSIPLGLITAMLLKRRYS